MRGGVRQGTKGGGTVRLAPARVCFVLGERGMHQDLGTLRVL